MDGELKGLLRENAEAMNESLKAAIMEEVGDVPPTLLVELVGRALGEIVGEMVKRNHDLFWLMCRDRLANAFKNGFFSKRGL